MENQAVAVGVEQIIVFNQNAKVGDWLQKKDPIYGSYSQGEIKRIENGVAHYFDENAADGFGLHFDATLDDCMVTINGKREMTRPSN